MTGADGGGEATRRDGVARHVVVLAALAALAVAHELLARALDSTDLIERLLSPSTDALVAVPAALALYALRLFLVIVGPGVALAAIVRLAIALSRRRATAVRSPSRGTT